jgi:hypothetical protein
MNSDIWLFFYVHWLLSFHKLPYSYHQSEESVYLLTMLLFY